MAFPLEAIQMPAVGAVGKVLPALPVDAIGGASQDLQSKIAQLVQGQEYSAQVTAKLTKGTYLVKLNGAQVQDLTLKLALGAQAQVGQQLPLKLVSNSPNLTFLLNQTPITQQASMVNLSDVGGMLNQYISTADANGVSQRIEATATVTQFPAKPQLMAHDLKHAVTNTGLFYESHLHAFSQGQYALSQLSQEPQNQTGFTPQTLLFQQLAVLENQRLSWHGEVWPGQKMAWDIYEQRLPANTPHNTPEPTPTQAIASELSIDFPNLGKVTAKLSLVDGRMRVTIVSEQAQTNQTLQQQKLLLAQSLTQKGQQLDALTMQHDE